MTQQPLVSVVMPSFNHARFIDEAIRSVLEQDYSSLELIIADGGSTDGTIDILRDFADRDRRVRWMSEADDGPAPAINKALSKARGTLIGWLNSDDRYMRGTLNHAVSGFLNDPGLVMVYGHGEHIDEYGSVIGTYPTKKPSAKIEGFTAGSYICQPAVFFKWAVVKLSGPLDESYSAAFDFEYWMRIFRDFPGRIGFVEAVLAQSRIYDDCITVRSRWRVALEGMRACAAYFGNAQTHWLSSYFEEITAQRQSERSFDNFKSHALNCLEEATPYLLAADLVRFRKQINDYASN